MSKLPHLRFTKPPAWQQERLQRWLLRWRLHLAGREAEVVTEIPPDVEPAVPPPRPPAPKIRPFDAAGETFRVGQIRLLAPGVLPAAERPVYFLMLSDWDGGWKLIAPFGPFTEPATPGELLTGLPDRPLQVLSLWNTYSLPIATIQQSWIVGDAPGLRAEAWEVFRQVLTGRELPLPLMERVGPPVRDPHDERVAYQGEEMRIMAPLATAARRALAEEERARTVATKRDDDERAPGRFELGLVKFAESAHAELALAAGTIGCIPARLIVFAGTEVEFMTQLRTGSTPASQAADVAAQWDELPKADPARPGGVTAEWELTGAGKSTLAGRPIWLVSLATKQWLGGGRITEPDGRFASLETGHWDQLKDEHHSSLVLVVFREG